MRRLTTCFLLCVLVLFAFQGIGSAQVAILHDFAGGTADGYYPYYGTPVSDGSSLYGMTYYGGASGYGVIYKMSTDGAEYELLHSFAGPSGDGNHPDGSLVLDGSTLYGVTYYGGASGHGIIFKINTDGSGFELLHSFAGGAGGNHPVGSLVLDGGVLYGMTESGGVSGMGAIFKMNTDGSGFELLHSFGYDDGWVPHGSLVLHEGALYGMTYNGGANNAGSIFSIDTDGANFAVLHIFAGAPDDGRNPWGSLVPDGSKLYGMTKGGGASNLGVLFSIDTNGANFAALHSFAGAPDDGADPSGSLTLDGGALYGMTSSGGGALFTMSTDGSNYELLHSFAGAPDDGANPYGSLLLEDSTLYGMTSSGGASNLGVIFSLDIGSEPTTTQPIPTLSEWGVIILAALLALAAAVVISRKALKPGRMA